MQEEYFAAFLNLYKKIVPLNIKLTNNNFPQDLPFGLYVKDFLHIVFGIEKYKDDTELAVTCNWGEPDSMVNVTVSGLEGNAPFKCILHTASVVPISLLTFTFTV